MEWRWLLSPWRARTNGVISLPPTVIDVDSLSKVSGGSKRRRAEAEAKGESNLLVSKEKRPRHEDSSMGDEV